MTATTAAGHGLRGDVLGQRLRSALLVEVPEAEPAVGAWRARLDPMAGRGVPAHITVLFPFAPPTSIDDQTTETLHRLFASVPNFDFSLVGTSWFEEVVLWLAPDNDIAFRTLTGLVSSAFPAYPPYGGQFRDLIPHLTIADHGPVHEMQAAEQQIQEFLPIRSTVRSVTLMIELSTGSWHRAATYPFSSS